MSNIAVIQQTIQDVSVDFNRVASHVEFEKEFQFAVQIMKSGNYTDSKGVERHSFLASVALKNPDTLKMALMSVASIGISLNPVKKLAYLIPRDGRVCLDISYMGYVYLACDSGAIKWVQASVVYEKDEFEYSLGEKPYHKFSPFGDRGKRVGVYCVAKTEDEEFLSEFMTIEECYSIRNRTDVWKKFEKGEIKSCPWSTDENEMLKKTVIKRASKLWPKNDKLSRLQMAVDKDNDENGINFKEEQKQSMATVNQLIEMREKIFLLNREESAFCEHMSNVTQRKISSLEDLTEKEADKATIQLNQFLDKQEKKNEENK